MQNTRNITRVPINAAPYQGVHTGSRSNLYVSPYAGLAKKILKRVRFHLLLYVVAFYLLPSVFSSTGKHTFMMTLLYPALCFILTICYGFRFGFIKHYLAIPIALYLPASLLFFKPYSFLYALCYLLICCIALTIGALYRQMSHL